MSATVLIFGDPQEYYFGERRSITVHVSDHDRFQQDEIVYKFDERVGGVVGQPGNDETDTAFVKYTGFTQLG